MQDGVLRSQCKIRWIAFVSNTFVFRQDATPATDHGGLERLLADRTNGRAYATVVGLSSSVTLCIVAKKRCVLDQKLILTANEKSLGTQLNDLDLCLEA